MESVNGGGKTPGNRKHRLLNRVLIIGGVSLIVAGLLVVAGVRVYVWNTNRTASQAQEELSRQWEQDPADPSRESVPPVGEPAVRIVIPRIEVDSIVVELAGLDDLENLNKGPGHIPGTAWPGEPGNMVISGHRTTYGAPFNRIDELEPGDEIIIYTASGRFDYAVSETLVVVPTDLSVLDQAGETRLTLTSCHPEFRASNRIVAVALFKGAEPLPPAEKGD
jgi:sortase A